MTAPWSGETDAQRTARLRPPSSRTPYVAPRVGYVPAPDPLAGEYEVEVQTNGMDVLRIITYVTVVVTCLAILYGMIRTYLFLSELSDALGELSRSFGAL